MVSLHIEGTFYKKGTFKLLAFLQVHLEHFSLGLTRMFLYNLNDNFVSTEGG